MINAVQIENKQFREDASEVIKKIIAEGKKAGHTEGGVAMGLSALVFIDRVRKALFGNNDVVMFTEEMFDDAVKDATTSFTEEAKEEGKNPVAALLICIAGMDVAAPLCRKYFPEEGANNG